MRNLIVLRASVVLVCVFLLCLHQMFGYQKIVLPNLPYRPNFRRPWEQVETKEGGLVNGIFPDKTFDTIAIKTLQKETHKSYSYDVAIVSMSPWWYSHSTLPRNIYCNGTNTSILMRKATKDAASIKRADILIFANHAFHSPLNWTKLRQLRQGGQLWVHTTGESAFHSISSCPPNHMNISFNLSCTYHPKADISVPYGRFIPFGREKVLTFVSNFNKKTKLIVWVSSHCSTPMWRRSDFANDLSEYLSLDIYGACGTLECPRNSHSECKNVFSRYKFYLAMENSCCGGYITEKFWDALTYLEAIPVVVGAPKSDYASLAPNNSYIHADNFGSMRELANYILKVANEKALYDSYFQWKRLGTAKKSPVESKMAFSNEGVCRLIKYERSASDVSLANHTFDPYGPYWFGGCNECGEQEWLKNYTNFRKILEMKKRSQSVK